MEGNEYVSSSILRLRKRIMASPDKTEALKDGLKSTVAFGLEDFDKRLRSGQVQINTVADFERMAKLGLLLYGEATEKVEVTTDIEQISEDEYTAIRDSDEVKKIQERLYAEMNNYNEDKG